MYGILMGIIKWKEEVKLGIYGRNLSVGARSSSASNFAFESKRKMENKKGS